MSITERSGERILKRIEYIIAALMRNIKNIETLGQKHTSDKQKLMSYLTILRAVTNVLVVEWMDSFFSPLTTSTVMVVNCVRWANTKLALCSIYGSERMDILLDSKSSVITVTKQNVNYQTVLT